MNKNALLVAGLLIASPLLAGAQDGSGDGDASVSTSINGGTIQVRTESGIQNIQIDNVEVKNGKVEVKSTVNGKAVESSTTLNGVSGKSETSVTVDGKTQVFTTAFPASFSSMTTDGTEVLIDGNTITITGKGTEAHSMSKVEFLNSFSTTTASGTIFFKSEGDSGNVHVLHGAAVRSNTALKALVDTGAITIEPASVQSDDDLALFVARRMQDDERITDSAFTSGSVAVNYTGSGKLFGIFTVPLHYVVTGDTETEDSVDVVLPWWSIFAKKPIANADLKAAVETKFKADAAALTNVSAKQAALFAALSSSLKANAAVTAEAH